MQTSISTTAIQNSEIIQDSSLAQWLREYATSVGLKTLQPDIQELISVVQAHLPSVDVSTDDIKMLLHQLGIDVIVDYGDSIAWLGTTDDETAEAMLEKYAQEPFSAIRKALGIDYLWVLRLQDDLMYKTRDIYEARVEFSELEEKPECVIIDL